MKQTLENNIADCQLSEIKRIGKELFFYFSNEKFFSLHLMLKGRIYIEKDDKNVKYKLASVHFENGEKSYICRSNGMG